MLVASRTSLSLRLLTIVSVGLGLLAGVPGGRATVHRRVHRIRHLDHPGMDLLGERDG